MLGTYASALLICVGSLVLGQAVLRLCGATSWSWLSAPVGLATMILIAIPSLHVPGRATTAAVVLALLIVAGAVYLFRSRAHRAPAAGLLGGLLVALLAAVPFIGAGHAGTLGWSFDNDMATHLWLADAYRSEIVDRFNPLLPDYPIGPHALVGVVAQGLRVGVDEAFAGLTIAGAVLLGWTALGALRQPRRWAPLVVAPLAGMPFLVAGYYGQGSFKELLEATFVLGFALLLAFPPRLSRAGRWVPAAVILAGAIAVYSFLGLVWPLAFLGVWVAAAAIRELVATGSPQAVVRRMRASWVPIGVAAGVLLLAIAPQLPRLASFISNRSGVSGGIARDDIGNLAGRLPIWEAFGIWGNPDYRLSPADQFANGMWVAFALGLVVLGAIWAIQRGEWMLVAATALGVGIWAVSDRSQSPYVAAKGLVILSPLLMVVAARALVERDEPRRRMPGWWLLAGPALAVLLLVRVGESSWHALRVSMVGPTEHLQQLHALQPSLHHRPTLFLGNDDFIKWELGETPVAAPVIGFQVLRFRREKPWVYGIDYDVDSLDSATLNRFDWVIAPRDAAASVPPPQLRPVRRTRDFVLYRRTGIVPPSGILPERDGAAAVPLDCRSARGRAIVRGGGVATIRGATHAVAVAPLGRDGSTTVRLRLTRGSWDLVVSYIGPMRIAVSAPGLRTTLPANLDRPGPRWPIGRIAVRRSGEVAITLRAVAARWAPASVHTTFGAVTAVPVGTERTVPIAKACGKLVDHYWTQAE
jgi:hypothetical protein